MVSGKGVVVAVAVVAAVVVTVGVTVVTVVVVVSLGPINFLFGRSDGSRWPARVRGLTS